MQENSSIKVLVVDDTAVYRRIASDVLAEIPGVEVIGAASNGRIAMNKIASLKPDLLTLDIEMPEMNGLEVLSRIKKECPDIGAVMLSTLTLKGGDMTMKALELGAFDFICKPQSGNMDENRQALKKAMTPILKAFSRTKEIKRLLKGGHGLQKTEQQTKKLSGQGSANRKKTGVTGSQRRKSEIVVIGISTGGPNALADMMPKLPPGLGAPILIVQHMPPVFTQSLAKSLNSKCPFEVREAVDGEIIQPGKALIAPGGKQMKVEAAANGISRIIRITDDAPENSCKPSADYLFRSVAHHYVGRATGVIMTGMGSDGTLGLKLMKRNSATIIAQDEASCVVYGMPGEAVKAGIVDVVAPLDKIAAEICRTVK